MKKPILLLFAVLSAAQVVAQFSLDRFYVYGEKTVNLSVQSATFDGDSVFVPYSHWAQLGDDCYSPDASSVLGREIRVSPNGLHQFVLAEGDTLTIDPDADLGQSWIAWTNGVNFVEATLSSEVQEEVLGNMETVRVVTLQRLDQNMEAVDAAINDFTFRFGEVTGLVGFPSLLNFPDFFTTPFLESQSFELVGLAENGVYQDLTVFDVYDFQPGDEIHFEEGQTSVGDIIVTQYAWSILNRTDFSDSIVYTVNEYSWFYSGPSSQFEPQPQDTVLSTLVIVPDSLFDLPAGAALVLGELIDGQGTFNWLGNSEFGKTKNYFYSDPIFSSSPSPGDLCFSEILDWGCNNTAEEYIEGLGGPYYDCQPSGFTSFFRKLVYYNTTAGEWGEPLSVRGIELSDIDMTVYPNPAADRFSIDAPLGTQIERLEVYDLQGRLIKSYSQNAAFYELEEVQSGMYRLLVEFSDGKFGSSALVIRD